MADSTSAGDLLPEATLSGVLLQGNKGLGSVVHVLRLAIAVTVSWLVALHLSRSSFGLFAPLTTLLVVQSSPWSTLGVSLQRVIGTGAGVLIATLWVSVVATSAWSFFAIVFVALLVARLMPWSIGGQLQIPVAVIFVMAIGKGSMDQDLWRILDVLIGGAVGIAAIYIYPPKPKPELLESELGEYRDAAIEVLEQIGDTSGRSPRTLDEGEVHEYVAAARALRPRVDRVRQELIRLAESAQFNPRGGVIRDRLELDAQRLRQLASIGLQVRGIAGSANLLYDREASPRLAVDDLLEVTQLTCAMARLALGRVGEPVASIAPNDLEGPDQNLRARLRVVADVTVARAGQVSDALGSVGLLGRLDHIRQQLVIFGSAGRDSDEGPEFAGVM